MLAQWSATVRAPFRVRQGGRRTLRTYFRMWDYRHAAILAKFGSYLDRFMTGPAGSAGGWHNTKLGLQTGDLSSAGKLSLGDLVFPGKLSLGLGLAPALGYTGHVDRQHDYRKEDVEDNVQYFKVPQEALAPDS